MIKSLSGKLYFYSAITLAIFVAVAVFYLVNERARRLEPQVISLNQQIKEEQERIVLLKREFDYLSRPSRILKKVDQILPHMQPLQPNQIITLDQLVERYGQGRFTQKGEK